MPDLKNSSADPKYMPQLDTLRAFAVFCVLISHWLPEHHRLRVFPFGYAGITLFFVLSGFLISEILIKSREIAEAKNQNKFHSAKQFYIRRTLRIFPIYYITLFILYIFNVNEIRDIFFWFLFYASNIYFFTIHSYAGYLSHFWTLAVEEQFYIIWPFIILFIPKKYLLRSIFVIISIGPLFRAFMYFINLKNPGFYSFAEVLTPSCMDSFGLGALLAYYRIYKNNFIIPYFRLIKLFFFGYIFVFTILIFFQPALIRIFFLNFNLSLIFLLLIYKTSIGFTGFLKIIFENKILLYLGKISYGMYLFHKFIPLIYNYFKLPEIQYLYFRMAVYTILLILISSLSWFLIERPINNLKRKFDYN